MDRLSAMNTFLTVVETGSFTRAADVLGLPKARVSQRISDLELYLGLRLVNRTTRSLKLTQEGEEYFVKCQRILQDIEELEGSIKGNLVQPRGQIRVEALVSVARWLIAPHIQEFKIRYPEINLHLGSSDSIRHLLEDRIDCTIRGGDLDDSSMIARLLCSVRIGLYASPAYVVNKGNPIHPEQLVNHSLISWFRGNRNPFSWYLEREKASFEMVFKTGYQFDDPDVAIAACMAGNGICPGVPFAVESWVKSGALIPILPEWSFEARPIHIIYSNSKYLSARVRCFIDWMLEMSNKNLSLAMSPLELYKKII